MVYYRICVFMAAISIMIAIASSSYPQPNQWELEIILAKDQYVLHEPIWLDVTLTNMATDTQRTAGLTAPNHRQFYIELKDSLGKKVKYTGPRYLIASDSGELLLAPGTQDFGSFDIAKLFQSYEGNSGYLEGKSGHFAISDFPYIPKGAYTLQVFFEVAVSREIAFTVVEPTGEASEVLELVAQASAAWDQKNSDPSARIFREAVERFPNSVFAERCYYLSEAYSMEARQERMRGPWTLRPVKVKMLEHYPNSGHARNWIASVTRDMDEAAKRDFLYALVEAHPDTRSAKYARVMQAQMSNQEAGE